MAQELANRAAQAVENAGSTRRRRRRWRARTRRRLNTRCGGWATPSPRSWTPAGSSSGSSMRPRRWWARAAASLHRGGEMSPLAPAPRLLGAVDLDFQRLASQLAPALFGDSPGQAGAAALRGRDAAPGVRPVRAGPRRGGAAQRAGAAHPLARGAGAGRAAAGRHAGARLHRRPRAGPGGHRPAGHHHPGQRPPVPATARTPRSGSLRPRSCAAADGGGGPSWVISSSISRCG